MRIAVLKPDWGIVGGFELVVQKVQEALVDADHDVERLAVDARSLDHRAHGIEVDADVWAAAPEFFAPVRLAEEFAALDLAAYDLVLCTQPATIAARHDRKLALFYHHHRVAYDLEDLYVAARLPGHEVHRRAAAMLRMIETPGYRSVRCFLTPSETVRARLRRYQSIDDDRMLPFEAGPIAAAAAEHGEAGEGGESGEPCVLCVSRSEFAKRTEWFADAAVHGLALPAVLAGSGGQLRWVRHWYAERVAGGRIDPERWRTPMMPAEDVDVPDTPLRFAGRVDDATLARLYRSARCVVAPAYDEDYGLTVLEAMAAGVPCVVCSDGGGLVELVTDGVDGLVVDPHPLAIAEGVRSIVEDPERAAAMAAAARRTAAAFTWDRARSQLLDGVRRTLGR
jgi:glycosyltransferase involved in cell wall biosynthesis